MDRLLATNPLSEISAFLIKSRQNAIIKRPSCLIICHGKVSLPKTNTDTFNFVRVIFEGRPSCERNIAGLDEAIAIVYSPPIYSQTFIPASVPCNWSIKKVHNSKFPDRYIAACAPSIYISLHLQVNTFRYIGKVVLTGVQLPF